LALLPALSLRVRSLDWILSDLVPPGLLTRIV
jgi:hypothetical protein